MFGTQVASYGQMMDGLLLALGLVMIGLGGVMLFVRYHHLLTQDHITRLVQDIHDKLDHRS